MGNFEKLKETMAKVNKITGKETTVVVDETTTSTTTNTIIEDEPK